MSKSLPKSNGKVSIANEAQRLHASGYWVVPCNGKVAIATEWQKKRLSPDELTEQLNGSQLNIGVVINQSNFIDVESDTIEAATNLQTMFGGEIPTTPTFRSSRGYHRLFQRPDGLPECARIQIDGIDFLLGNGAGAYCMVPPSIHPSGYQYRWTVGKSIHEIEPAELPAKVVERLRRELATSKKTPAAGIGGDICEGERSDILFKSACRLFKAKFSVESVGTMLRAENTSRCKPPLPDPEVGRIVKSASKRKSLTIADALLRIAFDETELWHTPDDIAFATIERDGHREHWRVRAKGFREWLCKQYYDCENAAVGSQTLQDVLNALEGKAKFDGPEHSAFLRVGGHDGKIFIDLVDEAWRAIEVDKKGWRIVDDPPVYFRRAKRSLPLPMPERGGVVDDLKRFVNVPEAQWASFVAFLLSAFRPTGPYPILKFIGEQGSAKTTAARVLRGIIDPNTSPTRSAPKSERDLMIAAHNGWLCSFDNLSYVTPELSDALCRLASGGGFGVRTHYENDEETVFHHSRPVILNGIEEIGLRSDLMDRSLVIAMPRIAEEDRQPEKTFNRDFELARPRILGALLDAVSAALRNLHRVEKMKTNWPRMADFAMWAVAGERALGLDQGAFLSAYAENRAAANLTALESSPVAERILIFIENQPAKKFEGTATELLNHLSAGQEDTKARSWPKSARALSGLLIRLAPNLRLAGLSVEQDRTRDKKSWLIKNIEAEDEG